MRVVSKKEKSANTTVIQAFAYKTVYSENEYKIVHVTDVATNLYKIRGLAKEISIFDCYF